MRRHWTFVLSLLVVAAIGTVVASSAQERQLGGVGITIFTDSNFRGKSATFREDVSDLVRHGLNDKISSLIVAPGEQWEVCEHTNYQGRCVVVSGEEPELKRHSWSDEISSFRRVSGSSGGGGGPVFPRPPSQDRYIVLYDQPNFRGNPMNYNEPVSNLAGFRAGSVTIGRGVWELCESPNFTGSCVTLDRSVPDLNAYGMRNRVASLRPSGGDGAYVPRPTRPTLPPQGESYIVLYDQTMYRGNPMNYDGPVSNLAGFRAGSVTIGRGVWEVCESPNFRGRCITLDRSVPDLNAYGMRNRVASVRPSGEGGTYVPPPTRPTPPSQGDWYIVLYSQPSYRGTPTNYKGAASYLSGSDRRAQSVTIGRGVWELCEGTNFRGRCVTLDRSVPDLNTYGLSGRVSSVRPVSGQPR